MAATLSTMTPRERFLATLLHQKPDRVPFEPGHGRQSTLCAWHTQGLPADVSDYLTYVRRLLGIADEAAPEGPRVNPGVVTTMIPEFEEKTIEERTDSRIVQDWKGNICEIGKQFDASHLRGAPDFVTRSWLRCPVELRGDWPDMARRYHVDQPGRFPADFAARGEALRRRNYPAGMVISGPFWQLREWCGFERLCELILDDPVFVQEMVDYWENFVAAMLERTFEHFVPDVVTINEDMAYKEKPMIGPGQCRQFMNRCWTRWGGLLRQAGVPIYDIDSDGHVGLLLPVWLECGVNSTQPMEVAAGNDLPAYRAMYGSAMSYRGGIDKRAMAAGGATLAREIERIRPVIEAGGYIPGCDHGVPADVSWPNFVDYCRRLAQATGWL